MAGAGASGGAAGGASGGGAGGAAAGHDQPPAAAHPRLPVTLISGFLGAGKTTLLQHVLRNKQGLRCAVIVNDVAELNIDAALVVGARVVGAGERLIELQSGCICCSIRGDLLAAVADMAAEGAFDYLVIESTGVADPMQVAEMFAALDGDDGGGGGDGEEGSSSSDEESGASVDGSALGGGKGGGGLPALARVARLDTCVTVVDAAGLMANLGSFAQLRDLPEAARGRAAAGAAAGDDDEDEEDEGERNVADLMLDQIEFADVILLNKADAVDAGQLATLAGVLRALNPSAEARARAFLSLLPPQSPPPFS